MELAPLVLPEQLSFSPEQFELVCAANPEAVLELRRHRPSDQHDPHRR